MKTNRLDVEPNHQKNQKEIDPMVKGSKNIAPKSLDIIAGDYYRLCLARDYYERARQLLKDQIFKALDKLELDKAITDNFVIMRKELDIDRLDLDKVRMKFQQLKIPVNQFEVSAHIVQLHLNARPEKEEAIAAIEQAKILNMERMLKGKPQKPEIISDRR